MIEAKGSREAAASTTAARDRYLLKDGDQRLSLPIALGALLVGIATYLKSALPAQSATAPESEDASGAPLLDEETSASTSAPAPEELHASKIVGLTPSEGYELIDSPAFDYADVKGSSTALPVAQVLRFRPSQTLPQAPRAESAAVVQFPSHKALPTTQETTGSFPGSSNAGQSAGGGTGGTGRASKDDKKNTAPRVNGPTYLNDVFGSAAVMLSITDLLRNASDPDGDALSVQNVMVSSGMLTRVEGGWSFKPDAGVLGDVTISYEITDGNSFIQQSASFTVERSAPIVGAAGDDNLVGTDGADDIDGGAGNDNIDGRDGNDIITTSSGDDQVIGGSGNDIIRAGDGNDRVLGGDGNDTIFGGSGNDQIFGGSGNDLLFGEAGADTVEGGEGNDTLSDGAGKDTVRGGGGNDHIVVAIDTENDTYDGGSGIDTLDISSTSQSLEVDLQSQEASGADIGTNSIIGVERVIAGSGDDSLSGSSADEELFGGAGNDVLCGEGGADNLQGGTGNDQIVASLDAAPDTYDGGAGSDTLDLSFATMSVEVDFTRGVARGDEIGIDTVRDFEKVLGGQGDDLFIIGEQSTIIKGGGGHNTFVYSATIATTDMPEAIHEILDFMVGDNIRIEEFELFRNDAPDSFQQQYGDDNSNSEGPIRIRHDKVAELERTYVEADLNADDVYEISIALYGNFSMSLHLHDV
jgi:Ca2+-binding RTX toxin-like protein